MEHSMAQTAELKAQARSGVGKGAARAVRRQGLIPAVIYGDKKDPLPVSLSYNDAMKRIYAGGVLSHVITLDVDGEKHRVLPRDYQLDPVSDKAMHVDFLRVGAGTRLNVDVHVTFVNETESPGLKRGGTLNIVRHTIELSCPVDAIPEEVRIDLTGLDIGDSVHIESVTLPEGVRPVIHERNFTIVTVVAPSGMKSEDEGTAAAAAEGEAAAPAAGAAPAGDAKAAAPAAGAKAAAPAGGDKGGKK
jgi:large subunit ribosomal protein L25